jgi:hypothetical protein
MIVSCTSSRGCWHPQLTPRYQMEDTCTGACVAKRLAKWSIGKSLVATGDKWRDFEFARAWINSRGGTGGVAVRRFEMATSEEEPRECVDTLRSLIQTSVAVVFSDWAKVPAGDGVGCQAARSHFRDEDGKYWYWRAMSRKRR